MSTRWSPKWKAIEIDHNNKKVTICYDETTKLYVCPICSPNCAKGVSTDYSTYFFNLEDLKRHLDAHKHGLWLQKKIRTEEEEEEPKLSVGEEEIEEE
ncbi:MAG: hypothetical protein QXY87_01855 [Saccharolobus sp.]|uniref:Uncharacterized protein n=2 Tax=Saccharolobus shibatae TaxID=2286 RepID=A0A8F5BSB2_9CREN|nr:hypothetical protein [Saccharolobus shibatae]MCH4814339.1 hypothetical protein [Saccharolobus shibatae]QXJ27253.1 Uncharacterized protein J5U23_00113 [Saccharolobus shibatae B12]QXJ30530.1 Uncharacterized protein J5U21_00172 [Saccharolobus shibatae]QXJ33576.1 Uncharacterized protein J5U22_00114 [Saccharolobus shibatae]